MNLSGFDLATRLTGWCAGDGSTIPCCGAFEFGHVGNDIGKLIDLWDCYLTSHFDLYRPQAVIYEAPILVVGKGRPGDHTDKPIVIRKIYNMGGHLEWFCRRRGVECFEVELHDVKAAVTRNKMAKKDEIVAIARRVGLSLPTVGYEDAADAFGAWLLGMQSYNPKLSQQWDRVVHSPVGTFLGKGEIS